jgi:signal transduction histidine kinase
MRTALLLALVCLTAVGLAQEQPRVLRRVADVRSLNVEEAKKGIPVDLEAQLTFQDMEWRMLFVAADGVGMFVQPGEGIMKDWWKVGARLRIKGITAPGDYLPIVIPSSLEFLGEGPVPEPRMMVTDDEIFDPAADSIWVELKATVKSIKEEHGGVILSLLVSGERCFCFLPQLMKLGGKHPDWIEQRVKIRGVAATQFNDQRQMSGRNIFVPSVEYITPLDPKKLDEIVPLRKPGELNTPSSKYRERVRVQGVVTYSQAERMLYIRGDGGSLRVEGAEVPALSPGARVEAEGFCVPMPFRPGLTATSLKLLSKEQPPSAIPFIESQPRQAAEQFELVSVEATLLQVIYNRREGTALLCKVGQTVFDATLPILLQSPPEPESRLQLTGICELDTRNPFRLVKFVDGFHLHLRSADDYVIVQGPPFWNEARLNQLLSAVGVTSVLIAAWAYTLRRRVRKQAAIIERQAEDRATLEERQRIARELHDTLEQELTGVAMLLDTTASRLGSGTASAEETLDLARDLLRHSREESRSTIRDLRSVAIEQLGLTGALDALLRPLADSAGVAFQFEVEGKARELKPAEEATLLRVGHEAVANAAKHSKASLVQVKLTFGRDQVQLLAKDDGVGFGPGKDGLADHFGLRGMRERAARVGGQLQISSEEGQGTVVKLTVPIPDRRYA